MIFITHKNLREMIKTKNWTNPEVDDIKYKEDKLSRVRERGGGWGSKTTVYFRFKRALTRLKTSICRSGTYFMNNNDGKSSHRFLSADGDESGSYFTSSK